MVYFTVVVPVLNEERYIEDTLQMLLGQDYPRGRFEIIVVDGGSTDGTRDVVQRVIVRNNHEAITLLDNPGQLSSSGRNIGIRASRGKYIAIIDGHVVLPSRTLLKEMEEVAERTGARALARPAPLDVPGLSDGPGAWIAAARKSHFGHSRKSFIYSDYEGFVDPMSSGFAYARTVFDDVGFFDESFDAAEDVEFHYRLKEAGMLAYTTPKFLIYSFPRDSLPSLFHQQKRYGEGRARLIGKHRGALAWETMIPSTIFIFFLLSPICFLGLFPVFLSVLWMCLLGTYALAVLLSAFDTAWGKHRGLAIGYIAVAIWSIHMGLGWGFLKALIGTRVGNAVVSHRN